MTFRAPTVEDALWAKPLMELPGYKSCEYAFANVYMWQRVFKTTIARMDDYVLVRGEGEETMHYLYPPGRGDIKPILDALLADAAACGKRPVIYSMNEMCVQQLETLYPGLFQFQNPQGQMDYIYSAEDLATLPGKKYQKKRNHCSRFERSYPGWAFHKITKDAIGSLIAFNNEWANLYDNRGDEGLADEHIAVERALTHYEALGLRGGYVTVNGEVVAFSFGSPLGAGLFVTHVEKALYDIAGAYNIINREMARCLLGEFEYINRENDVDEEGLRTAKQSYHPLWLEAKYMASPHKG